VRWEMRNSIELKATEKDENIECIKHITKYNTTNRNDKKTQISRFH